MISFIISQVIGCIVFLSVNFALYGFLKYKRNKVLKKTVEPSIFGLPNMGITLVSMVFFCSCGFRAYYLRPVLDSHNVLVIEKTILRKLETAKISPNRP